MDLLAFNQEGRSIPAAIGFLYEHAMGTEDWPYRQIEPIDWRMVWPVFQKANGLTGMRYPFATLSHRMPGGFDPELFQMIEPLHPFGQMRSPAIAQSKCTEAGGERARNRHHKIAEKGQSA